MTRVRTVAPGDLDGWTELWAAYNAFYGRAGPTALPAETTRTTWARFLDDAEPVHAAVAERDGRLVGLVHHLFHRSTVAVGPSCYLQDLYVAESARGHGVARALVESVYERARAAGSPRVYWQTHESNATAMRLYDRLATRTGFVVYAHDPT